MIEQIPDSSSKSQLKKLFDLVAKIQHDNKIFFVFDCDADEYNGLLPINNTIPFVFKQNPDNSIAKKGIENLFPESLFTPEFTTLKSSQIITMTKVEI